MTAEATCVLKVEELSKAYGGVAANSGVTLDVREREVHGLIGPNGAGKTTLIAMLGGDLRPDSGRILLDGVDVTGLKAPKRALLGIRRSFQITSVFLELSVLENAMLACNAVRGARVGLWRRVGADRQLVLLAEEALSAVGIEHLARRPAGALSHGERRHLELAMVLVGRPRVLLLDEPFAGMGPEETARMVQRLTAIKEQQAMLLIEHDLDAVFSLADRLTVMVMGRPIASGEPDAVRSDPAVQAAYLGTKDAA